MEGLGGLRGQVFSGLAWKVLSQVVGQGGRLVVAVLLARLLAPRDYGLAGMGLVFSSLVLVFSDLALGAALVQREKLSDARPRDRVLDERRRGRGLHAGRAGRSAGPLAAFYGEPDVKPLLQVLSMSS